MSLYFYDIQILRFISVVIVILYHLGVNKSGFIGVDTFFVISGFIMTYQYRKLNSNYMLFFTSRIRRLFPSAYTILTFFYTLNITPYTYMEYKYCIFFNINTYFNKMKNDYFHPSSSSIFLHYWSLAVEMKYYIFCPLFIISNTFNIIILIYSIFKYILQSYKKTFIYFNLLTRLYEFNIGIFGFDSQVKNCSFIFKLLSCIMLLIVSIFVENNIFTIPLSVSISYIFLICRVEKFRFIFLEYIGNMSYIIYLIHYPLTIQYKYYLIKYFFYLILFSSIFNYVDGIIQIYFKNKGIYFILITFLISITTLLTVSKYMLKMKLQKNTLMMKKRNINPKNDYIITNVNIYNDYKCFENNVYYRKSIIVIGDSHSFPLIGVVMNFCRNRNIYLYFKYIHTQFLLDYHTEYLEDIDTSFCLILYTNYIDKRYHNHTENYIGNTKKYFYYLLHYSTKILYFLPTPVLYDSYSCSRQIHMKRAKINKQVYTNYNDFSTITIMKNVIIINITKSLCNNSYCSVVYNNQCLYTDTHHLIYNYFELFIHNIIDISNSICIYDTNQNSTTNEYILYRNNIHRQWHFTERNCKLNLMPVPF